MQLPPLPPAPDLLPTTPRALAQPPHASVGCACASTPGRTAVPLWRMPKISEEQPLAPSLRRHVAPVVQRKMQAGEAQEQAEQAQEVLPVFPDWGPGGDTGWHERDHLRQHRTADGRGEDSAKESQDRAGRERPLFRRQVRPSRSWPSPAFRRRSRPPPAFRRQVQPSPSWPSPALRRRSRPRTAPVLRRQGRRSRRLRNRRRGPRSRYAASSSTASATGTGMSAVTT